MSSSRTVAAPRTQCAILGLAMLVSALLGAEAAPAQSVRLLAEDAVVWAQEQVVEGVVEGSVATAGTLYAGDDTLAFAVTAGTFAVPVRLAGGGTSLVACVDDGAVCSDTLRYELGFEPRPEGELTPTVDGRQVTLRGTVVGNPEGLDLTFAWRQDADNPAPVALRVLSDSVATFALPPAAPEGEYYFDWGIEAADGGSFRARTFVTVSDSGVVPFDLMEDHAAWIDDAIIYSIAPRLFSDYQRGRLRHITARIPELVDLGINTLWLQPIFPYGAAPTASQMYDVADYFEVWEALGTKEDLRTLVEAAHASGLRVMLDFVANHSSIAHPYAQDAIAHGARSHYYDFYMRTGDGAPYGQYYETLRRGEMTFLYYFWDDLVTWNYATPEVERFIIEASRYWVEAFDIDGYRFDAVWGPHARDPAFTQRWRRALKRVKPDVLLLAEAKATYSEAYEPTGHPDTFESFDVAYDWTDSDDCISQWAWARRCSYSAYEEGPMYTLFNSGVVGLRTRDLRNALTNYGEGYPQDTHILRYLENNDLPRFRAHHTLAQTKMAAALLFAVPGIPMLYYGQAIGTQFQYPSYPPGDALTRYDRDGVWPYYQHLIRLRKTLPALTSPTFEEIRVSPSDVTGHVFAFRRWHEEHHVVAALNMADEDVDAVLELPVEDLEAGTTYHLTDLLAGESRVVTTAEMAALAVELPAFSTRLWILSDTPVDMPTATEGPAPTLPGTLVLEPSYPNPFRSTTALPFETPLPGWVRLSVYDMLGRQVATLLEGSLPAGRHEASLDGRGLAAGLYLYRLEHEGQVRTGTVMLLR